MWPCAGERGNESGFGRGGRRLLKWRQGRGVGPGVPRGRGRRRGGHRRWVSSRTTGSRWLRVALSEAAACAHGGGELANGGGWWGAADAVWARLTGGGTATWPGGQRRGAEEGGREKPSGDRAPIGGLGWHSAGRRGFIPDLKHNPNSNFSN
jgi:hypothetical protein